LSTLNPAQAIELLRKFGGDDLTLTLSQIESSARGVTIDSCLSYLAESRASRDALAAAAEMKRLAGQINVVIHALGILLCLPHILEEKEHVEYVSLGAGNTGRAFDLETNLRVAEFKFIHWRGGPESIRQNSIFKDFFLLADSDSQKRKYLYVLGSTHPTKFFNGGRALSSVLSKDNRVRTLFYAHHGDRFTKVRDYYECYKKLVFVEDVTPWLRELDGTFVSEMSDDGPQ
jgi:hypothetical protein